MRLIFRVLGALGLLLVVLVAVAVGDLTVGRGRLFNWLIGRDAMVEACRPVLQARLEAEGFQPHDIEFSDQPSLAVSSTTGRVLESAFTFEDGAAGLRVDGALTCTMRGKTVEVTVRTNGAPMRAT